MLDKETLEELDMEFDIAPLSEEDIKKLDIDRELSIEKPRKHPLYTIWKGMRGRCYSPGNSGYANYGGRGIVVDEVWNDYMVFFEWSIRNGYEKGLSLDRINVNGNYAPENCRWATYRQQGNNTRTNKCIEAFGETKTISYWGDDIRCAIPVNTLYQRIENGWEPERAIITPSMRGSTARPATFDWYQAVAESTAVYPSKGDFEGLMYTALGLSGEAGEVNNKLKKIIRDKDGVFTEDNRKEILAELSDVLWYISAMSSELGLSLGQIASDNINKLQDRLERGVIQGSGDNR
jgi:NTP pyrophosphatase (non-canonical NTP hydrolase)